MGGDRQIRLGDIPNTRVLGSDRALSYQQYPPQVRGDVIEGGAGDGDQAGGYFGGVKYLKPVHATGGNPLRCAPELRINTYILLVFIKCKSIPVSSTIEPANPFSSGNWRWTPYIFYGGDSFKSLLGK